MIVYVVVDTGYEHTTIESVFSDEVVAQNYADKLNGPEYEDNHNSDSFRHVVSWEVDLPQITDFSKAKYVAHISWCDSDELSIPTVRIYWEIDEVRRDWDSQYSIIGTDSKKYFISYDASGFGDTVEEARAMAYKRLAELKIEYTATKIPRLMANHEDEEQWNKWELVDKFPRIVRNESTELGKKIWAAVDRGAARAPQFVKDRLNNEK